MFIILIAVMMTLSLIFVFSSKTKAEPSYFGPQHPPFISKVVPVEEKKNYSRFYKVKDEVRGLIAETAELIYQNYVPQNIQLSMDLFKKILNDKLAKVKNIQYNVFFDDKYNKFSPFSNEGMNTIGIMVGSVLVAYEDDGGSIAWRFDVVFEENIKPVILYQTLNSKEVLR